MEFREVRDPDSAKAMVKGQPGTAPGEPKHPLVLSAAANAVASQLIRVPAPGAPSKKCSAGCELEVPESHACSRSPMRDPKSVPSSQWPREPRRSDTHVGFREPVGELHSHKSVRGLPCPGGG